MNKQYNQCPICHRTYEVFNMYCGDQSKCLKCREAEKQAAESEDTPEQIKRRQDHFGFSMS